MSIRICQSVVVMMLSLVSMSLQAAGPENPPPVLTLEEAASLLRVDVQTLELMAIARTIPGRQIRREEGSDVFRFSRKELMAWLEDTADQDSVEPDPSGTVPATQTFAKPPAASALATHTGTPEISNGDSSQRPTSTEVFLSEQGVMGAAGRFSFDVGTFYVRQDSLWLINDDNPRLETTTTRIGLLQGVLRYSTSDATEIFMRASAERRSSRLRLNSEYQRLEGAESRTTLAVGIRHRLIEEGTGHPELILGLEGRLPTDTSAAGASASASFVKSLDPAVLFGSIAFTFVNVEEFNDTTLLEPNHTWRLEFGYALAMNDRFSLNVSTEVGYRSRTELSGIVLPEDDFAGLQFGMTIKVSPGFYLQPVVGYSLNGVGGAYTLGLSVPYSF